MPPHGRAYDRLKEPIEEDSRSPQSTSILGDNTPNVHEGSRKRDQSVYADVEERFLLRRRQREGGGGEGNVRSVRHGGVMEER